MSRKNIALIGFMATGKSTIGKALAEKMGREFIEMDKLIEEKAKKSIPEIFREDGEIRFRELEMEVCKELSQRENAVISCGGGVVLNKLNIDYLKLSSYIILLEADIEEIYKRALRDGKEKRPLLNTEDPLERIKNLLEFRRPFYHAATDLVINTSGKTVEQIVEEILKMLPE